jgi:hypothetical protein
MNRTKQIWLGIAMLLALFVLFEVRINFEFSLPREGRHLDMDQEERYASCYAGRDLEIHDVAFGTIDNPDVQKLYIRNNRDKAQAECRRQFPEQWVTVAKPFRFNVVDLRFRY